MTEILYHYTTESSLQGILDWSPIPSLDIGAFLFLYQPEASSFSLFPQQPLGGADSAHSEVVFA